MCAATGTHRNRFVDDNLPVLARELHGIHQRIRLAVGRGEGLSNVLDRLVIIDLRQINGISTLSRGREHLNVLDIVAKRGKILFRFHLLSFHLDH